jgi:hypothetical protein
MAHSLYTRIAEIYRAKPLHIIIFVALLIRLLAVFFAKGFGMHDDHFLVIESAQSFVDGYDYNNWLPSHRDNPEGHNWFYTGLHYLILSFLKWVGINDPQLKMYIIRFIHALYSLWVVYLAYKICAKLTHKHIALQVAWLMALLWFFPNSSVRNLIEYVCIVPLLASTLYLLYYNENKQIKHLLYSGLLMGLAMGIRYQTIFFFGGTGLYLLIRKDIRAAFIFGISALSSFFLTQTTDIFMWGYPFAEMIEYYRYNFQHATTYFNRPWYMYLLTVGGMLIPPFSLFLIIGYACSYKKYLLVFLPSFLFFLLHSYFPNKQERFILPFIPYLLILGYTGIYELSSPDWLIKFRNFSVRFFWVVNTILIIPFSVSYSKRSYVESMYYLHQQPDFKNFYFDYSQSEIMFWPPQYYTGNWNKYFYSYKSTNLGETMPYAIAYIKEKHPDDFPEYILFLEKTNLPQRVAEFEQLSGKKLRLITVIEPGWLDRLLHWLNPYNRNEQVFIYRAKDPNDY